VQPGEPIPGDWLAELRTRHGPLPEADGLGAEPR
jgi:hypothetical protein